MKTVAVLMSTYNGEKYLREQIDSILNQSNVDVRLFVRDDGSSDNTKEILTEYAEKYDVINLDFAENAGVGNSFMNLLYSAPDTFDYYAFADQDDIWESKKLFEATELLQKSGKFLYASNQENVDKNGNSLGLRYDENCKIHMTPVSILEKNMIAGCTMVVTNDFYRILIEESRRPSEELLNNRIHDVWLAMVASVYDGIVYDKRSFIKYRQHENNVVGAGKSSLSKRIKERTKKLSNKKLRNGRSKLAQEICLKFPEQVEKYPFLKVCANAKKLRNKRKLIKAHKELRSYTGESYLGFVCKVTLGLF
ncbi:MAG: glycosyltransferase family 2 protein [Clostridia bacterium]|nr:glycosyltransferase family 2 protein [Clostridia bacterium]